MSKVSPEYIVVEGPIGVGKTTLARRLAQALGTDLLLEAASENPFLPKFYQDPRSAALPTQLHFLFQRVRQVELLKQTDMFKPSLVADFIIQKDSLFAKVTLDEHELDLYYQVYDRLTLDVPAPDLVIYLQAPTDDLVRRVHERGVNFEKNIKEDYLQAISDAYINFFYDYTLSPLLIVNTTDFDLASSNNNFEILLKYIQDLSPGRHYFNPKAL
ncbi:MAG: deoxyguanosine kinase [Gammaproteobacteria bacterium]|jgi:deoxyguanosine kinase